jgi:acyl-CoA oxidase
MRTERERASFPVRELTYLLHGGRERTETKEKVAAIFEKDPKLRWDDRYFLSREANFEKMLSQVAHTLGLVKELNITDPAELSYFRYFLNSHNFTGYVCTFPFPVSHDRPREELISCACAPCRAGPWRCRVCLPLTWSSCSTHWSMFVETLEGQGTDEQKAKWLDAAKRYHILGCYAQTELGHGSNVRGLETTATYDKQRQEFVLNRYYCSINPLPPPPLDV